MMGIKERNFAVHQAVSLEALVPADNFYRQLETKVNLSFVRELVQEYYTVWGRPSIDPVVFFKLQLIMFFEDIRSERQLMEVVAMRLDHRWYVGYDLKEALPDHSSLSKIRDRYGVGVFQAFFEKIVALCVQAGLVWGEEIFFDGTIVAANAAYEQQVPRFYQTAIEAHLKSRSFPEEAPAGPVPALIQKYTGQQSVVKPSSYKKRSTYWVSSSDPDATAIGMGATTLGYRVHYGVDGGKARIILACLVTPSTIQDNTPLLDLTYRTRFRWQLPLKRVIADMRYGTGENLAGLVQQGLTALIPPFRQAAQQRDKLFPKTMFTYDAVQDCYRCPRGEVLTRRASPTPDTQQYRAPAVACRACSVRDQCTGQRARTITHSIYKPYEDQVAQAQSSPAFQKAMRKRQVWIEPKFGEVKQWHRGRRFRLRTILKVNTEALIRASGQNLKQLLKVRRSQPPLRPAHCWCLAFPSSFSADFNSLLIP